MASSVLPRLRDRLGEEVERLRGVGPSVRWVEADNYHLTWAFLGEVDDDGIMSLHRLLKSELQGERRIQAVAKGLTGLPKFEEPRVVVCGVRGRDEAEESRRAALETRLKASFAARGFVADRRSSGPHITLGRVQAATEWTGLSDRMGPARNREFAHFSITSLTLYESQLRREGSLYLPLQSYELRG